VPSWLAQASDDDLVRSVQRSRQCVDALTVSEPMLQGLGEEEHWRWVGRLAPVAEYLLSLVSPMLALMRLMNDRAPTADTQRFMAAFDGPPLGDHASDNNEDSP
jgi:hypothetical protein